ncbi:unnamed protein product [Dovyalis caffra]|uniref:Uncharacterized protein n=1 Tax=Dovyalis caffra TaxID=77055 RepID=A0AAV1R627_9ROSI|nr:unnamed protein product [Dovyalis caffra]
MGEDELSKTPQSKATRTTSRILAAWSSQKRRQQSSKKEDRTDLINQTYFIPVARSGYGLGKESERLNENRHRMELIGSPLLKKRRRRAQGSTSSSYYDYVSFDYRDLAHSMPSTKEVFSTSGSSVEWKPPKEKNATLSKGEGRSDRTRLPVQQREKRLSSILSPNRMGPNKLSTFVPAANKSEVSLESELAALVLVQDRKVWDRLLMALEASNTRAGEIDQIAFEIDLFHSGLRGLFLFGHATSDQVFQVSVSEEWEGGNEIGSNANKKAATNKLSEVHQKGLHLIIIHGHTYSSGLPLDLPVVTEMFQLGGKSGMTDIRPKSIGTALEQAHELRHYSLVAHPGLEPGGKSLGIRKLYWIRSAESVPGFGTKIHSVSRDQQLIGSTDLGLSGLDGKALEVSLPYTLLVHLCRFGVRSVHREDRPPNSKFFPGSFNLVDYDNSRDYGRATRDAEQHILKLKRTLESASKGQVRGARHVRPLGRVECSPTSESSPLDNKKCPPRQTTTRVSPFEAPVA